MSSGAIEYEPINKLHLQVNQDTTLYHFLDAIEKQLDILSGAIDIAQDQFQVNEALGTSLDDLALLFGIMREDGVTDTAFRTMLAGNVADVETQTKQVIEDMVEYITGYPDSVDEYPDVDFVVEYGLPNNTAVRIRLPINLNELYAVDVFQQSNRLIAGGVAIVIESLVEWFESFVDVVTVEDMLLSAGTSFFDETISGWPVFYGEGWDSAEWDDGLWDASLETTSDWFEYFWSWSMSDILSTPTDELLLVSLYYLIESLTTITSDLNAIDTVWTEDITTFTDVLLNILDGTFTETMLSSALDDIISGEIDGLLTESITTFVDQLLGQLEGMFTEHFIRAEYSDWDNAEWDAGYWDGGFIEDILLFEYGLRLLESISAGNLTDAMLSYGESVLIELLTTPVSEMNVVDTAWTEIITTFADVMSDELEGSFTETILSSALDDIMLGELEGVLTEDLLSSALGYIMLGEIEGILTESTGTPTDVIIASWDRSFTETLERTAYARIGIARIGVDRIGPAVRIEFYLPDWDGAEWDDTEWDMALDTLFVFIDNEVF